MRLVFMVVLLAGLGLAGFAAYTAKEYIDANKSALAAERARNAPQVALQPAFVVNRAVAYGERLSANDVRLVAFPVEATPEGVFRSEEELFPNGTGVERSVLRAMEPNEAVLASKVTKPGEDAGVSARLAEGMRAFAIRVDVATGVSGFLRPGDRVDVYWSGTLPASSGERENVTKLIDTNVRLVAIDQSAEEDRSGATVARTVTVEASPRQVAALAQAQATGSLFLSLVGAEDISVAEAVEIDQRELLGLKRESRVEVQRQEVCTVRTRRGSEVVEIPVTCRN
ncbi:pilus assembly protein CpaB [Palleronia aestuarii]|uniref:Pilus assembly protein CpaB n=1 Tax=Palleronia aestuarii TaxID=568105 RepID=A0A2W7NJP9_9RHOB|nr:Flp pilus assembly protein CpaB [Palleronia aestuarii]PZX19683.1 pilus assembly protein CpaB [Palleronia aestuarii]